RSGKEERNCARSAAQNRVTSPSHPVSPSRRILPRAPSATAQLTRRQRTLRPIVVTLIGDPRSCRRLLSVDIARERYQGGGKMRRAVSLALTAAFTACWLASLPAAAQEYPARPIRWIVPVPPGATTDILSRIIGQKMGEAWGQQVIVDNRSGGAFVIGTDIIAKANPDGYTIGILLTPHVVTPFVMKDLPYDSVKDFQPITQIVFVPGVMVANASVPANSLKEVIALAKAKPGQL